MRLPAVAAAATIGRRGAGGAARFEEVRQPVEFARLRMNRPAANTPARMTKPAAFEEAENRIRESVNALGCEVLGAWIESLDDGALRVERAGQRRFRVAAPAFARAGFAEDDHEHTRPGDLQAGDICGPVVGRVLDHLGIETACREAANASGSESGAGAGPGAGRRRRWRRRAPAVRRAVSTPVSAASCRTCLTSRVKDRPLDNGRIGPACRYRLNVMPSAASPAMTRAIAAPTRSAAFSMSRSARWA